MNIIKRMVRTIRSKMSNKSRKSSKTKKIHKSRSHQKGGAIYTFDLNDKIGGLPANISLNGTRDGDCPQNGALDLGFTNYGLTKGGNRNRKHRSHKSKKSKVHRKK